MNILTVNIRQIYMVFECINDYTIILSICAWHKRKDAYTSALDVTSINQITTEKLLLS
jgi:uncharacterized membrane protein